MNVQILEGRPMKAQVREKSVGQFFFDLAEAHGDKIFQIDAGMDIQESYKNVKKRSVRAAIEMQKRGVVSADTVAFVQGNTVDTVVPMLAAYYLGATVTNLDSSCPERELKHLVSLVSPKMVFTDSPSTSMVDRILQETGIQAKMVVVGTSVKHSTLEDFIKPSEDEHSFLPVEVDLGDTIFITFSSGSTGLSKAIEIDHKSFLHLGFCYLPELNGNFDVLLNPANFQWVSATFCLSTVFITGGCRLFYSSYDQEDFFRAVEKYKVTAAFIYALATYGLLQVSDPHKYDTSSLTLLMVGGNPLAGKQLERTQNLFKHATVVNAYGQSEAGFLTAFDPVYDARFIKTKTSSCGKPLAGVSIKIDAGMDIQESYKNVKKRSVRAAIEMQKRGVVSADTVAFVQGNTVDTVVPMLAAYYLGATVTNLDSSCPERELKHLVSLVSPKMVFTDSPSTSMVDRILQETGIQAKMVVVGTSVKHSTLEDFIKPSEDEHSFLPVEVDLGDTIFITFSSGSTGLSKAIEIDHKSFLHLGFCYLPELNGNFDVLLNPANFQWVSATFCLSTVFITGGCRLFYSSYDQEDFFRAVEKYKVTAAFIYALATYGLLQVSDPHKYDTSSLTLLMVGGNPLAGKQLERTQNLFKHATVVNAYGQSEAGFLTAFDPVYDARFIKTKTSSCGKPLAGVSIKIVDPNTHETLGPNQVGEICCKTLSMMKGYKGVDTSELFLEDGFLKTGDVGYYDDDQCIYVVDRIREMFNCGECRIVPAALEAILLEHPEIAEAAVIGIPDEEMGGLPAGCVVLKKGSQLGREQIDEYFSKRVIDGERLVGGIKIVKELPKTSSGKMKKRELRAYFENR